MAIQITKEVQEMCCICKGAKHEPAPIPQEGEWTKVKKIEQISGLTHGCGCCAPQQGTCKLTLNVKDFIGEKINPEMKKLGLDGLIPELEKNMYEEYKSKHDISYEEFENLSVGEIRKNIKTPKMEILRAKVNTVVTSNENEDERMVV